jgi:DNA uptake protein ComE-like DNA-binding protein
MTNRFSALLGAAAVLALSACGGDSGETETGTPAKDTTAAAAPAAAPAPPATDTTAAAPAPGQTASAGFLDPNTASAQELLTVPGFDQALADAVVAGRPYADMTAVDKVVGTRLGTDAQRDAAYGRLWKPINLNTASREEILLIPNLGPKMAHEFEEYRPYRNIEQFRREIGKYVDDAEVGRLERFVTLN